MKKLNSLLLLAMLFLSVGLIAQSNNTREAVVEPVVKTATEAQQKSKAVKSTIKKNLKTKKRTATAKRVDLADRLRYRRSQIPYRLKN